MPSLLVILRGLLRTPLFSAVAVLSLALGIGANTAMFSFIDQLLLRSLPVKNPAELVYLYHPGQVQGSSSSDEGGGSPFSYPMFRNLQKLQTPFVGLAGARNSLVSLAYRNSASHGVARLVSGNYFELLGVRPAIGRLLTPDDDRTPGGHPLAVLSYGYWTTRFGNSPEVLNQTILVNEYPLTIVGVAQRGFFSERLGSAPELYAPICMKKQLTPDWNGLDDRRNYWVTLFARLKPGVSMEQAQTAINVSYRSELEQDIQLLRQPKPDFLQRFRSKKVILKPGEHGRGGLDARARQPALLLMGITVLVLLIACANVANLQLARGAARTREVAVRLAMGASRMQLVRQLLTESCLVALCGGLLGLVAARFTVRAILAGIPPSMGFNGYFSGNLDSRILLYSLMISLGTGILFGLFPALQSSKADVVTRLKDQAGQVSSGGSANSFRKTLVTTQIAVSLLLLISAGLFGKSLVNLANVDLGVRVDHLMTFSVMPKLNQYTDQRIASFHDQLLQKLSGIPGVQTVSAAQVPAIADNWWSTSIRVEGYNAPPDNGPESNYSAVSPGYFRTMGVPLITGREFRNQDTATAPKVALVNEAFVRKFWPNQSPLGRHLGRGSGNDLNIEVVGVVKDSKYASMKEPPPPVFYTPLEQNTRWNEVYYYLRTAVPPDRVGSLIRREVATLDPNLPIREMKTMEGQIEENMFSERLLSTLTATFAGLATLLAAVGLYGVLAFNVARRTREIGIRMALGANAGRVRRMVLREVALLLAIGSLAGVGGAAAAAKLVGSFLFGMKPWDPAISAGAAAGLWAIALGAAYLPMRRAVRVDPMVALRYE